MTSDCPVEVYVAPGVYEHDGARHFISVMRCARCGEPLDTHPIHVSKLVPPGQALAVDKEKLLDLGEPLWPSAA